MEVPCLKVSVCAFPPKQGAVVNLYQLPVGVVTKVPEESTRKEVLKYNRMFTIFYLFYFFTLFTVAKWPITHFATANP